jgi:hypothetical protein
MGGCRTRSVDGARARRVGCGWGSPVGVRCVFRSGPLAFGCVRVRCLCVRCPVPGAVSAVACPSSRVCVLSRSRSLSAFRTLCSCTMFSWASICCRNMTSRKVRCASVAFWKASKIFFSATLSVVFLSTAFHTMPYAPLPNFCTTSYFRSTCLSARAGGGAARVGEGGGGAERHGGEYAVPAEKKPPRVFSPRAGAAARRPNAHLSPPSWLRLHGSAAVHAPTQAALELDAEREDTERRSRSRRSVDRKLWVGGDVATGANVPMAHGKTKFC